MKTETSPLGHYAPSPLKVIQTGKEDLIHLRILKREIACDPAVTILENGSIIEPANWDVSWFANYE